MTNSSGMMNHVRSSLQEWSTSDLDPVKINVSGKSSKSSLNAIQLLVSAILILMSFSIKNLETAPRMAPRTWMVEALPFPAPNLQNCRSTEGCCTPALTNKTKKFTFQSDLPVRIRPAAHRVDDAYIAKYQRATELMRALPDTDGRSFLNQYKLHCAYCDNNLYFGNGNNGSIAPLEIHRSWLFFPWHRLFLYFHERILATLIDDDTFALPFWNWDNQDPDTASQVVPKLYSLKNSLAKDCINKTSSLYDPDRTACASREGGFLEYQNASACPPFDRNETAVREANAHLMYMNVVGVGATPQLFLGSAYRYGDEGGGGEGCMEAVPHGSVHGWVNERDMEGFKDSASDPVFFGHHANLDRLWEVWKGLPGGNRGEIADPDFRETGFTFYDEEGGLVTVSVEQALQVDRLRYKYEDVPNPWLHRGAVSAHSHRHWKICNKNNSPSELATLIKNTKPFQGPVNFTKGPITFKVPRPAAKRRNVDAEEILEIRGDVNFSKFVKGDVLAVTAFAFHPEAQIDESMACGEYLGVRWLFTHTGISQEYPPTDVWRTGVGHQMREMGTEHLEALVLTLVGSSDSVNSILITDVRLFFSKA